MHIQIKTRFLFYTFTLFLCLNSFFLSNTDAQTDNEPTPPPPEFNFTYESIDVPGVEFLALTASSDFEDYAGYTKSADGEKMVAFTLIDGVFTTYDFPGSQNTYFYAFGNNGLAAGHYEDSEGLHHGIILEDGKLRQYDFPDAIETEIYGYSDSREVLTGSFIDTSGVRRGFSGDIIIEVPEATATYADFVNASGAVTGSYIDADGLYHPYVRTSNGTFVFHDYLDSSLLEYFFVHGITDTRIIVARAKATGDIPRSYAGTSQQGLSELQFPGSVSTEGWNINQDGSVVGYYDSPDGRRHGFIARPTAETAAQFRDIAYRPPPEFNYTYESIDVPGVEFLALTASSDFEDYAGNTWSADGEKIVGFTLIDGVFTTYDFPGSQNTYFYALGNNGLAAGHYEDSNGLFHGVVLENGELRQYDFPGAVETEIYGYSDTTGALTGNFIDASGVRRGFSGDIIVEAPEATATYADFVNAAGSIIGSYVDTDGLYHAYARTASGRFITLDYLEPSTLEYFFLHGINDAEGSGVFVIARAKAMGDLPRSYVGSYLYGLHELQFPGSVSTEGWNINQDGSVVGHYDTPDGRRHGFIARLDTADTPAQVDDQPVVTPEPVAALASDNYTFETINVPGVEFLAVTASSDFQDYAGNTPSVDGEKMVAFTLIDGVFTTYDFPGSKNTYFYALGNNGLAAGHYEDSNGLFHGVILQDGELRQYDFPNSVETEIYGYSDSTGALTGNFTDAAGVRRGFSGETIVEFPGASETYADFVSGLGNIVGSYVDTAGGYHAYLRGPGGSFATLGIPEIPNMEYFFLHGINDALVAVGRAKAGDGVPLTFVGNPVALQEFKVPGAVSTEGWNINQDSSVVGHYTSADGTTHGFIARPVQPTAVRPPPDLSYTFESINVPGVDFLAVTASSDFEDYAGNMRGPDGEKDVAFTLIDGVFTTYDFPGSQGTYFYALGNNGVAAGHYKDSNGLSHGVILENGELRQYDFPNAVETEIYGYSDSTEALTGSFVDTSGVRRGFSGDTIVEYPGTPETYADFVSWTGHIVGSYVDADGVYHAYMRSSVGRFLSIDLPNALNLEYFFLHGLNRARTVVGRAKAMGDVPRTYVGSPLNLQELQVPGAVSTEGWNINEDGSVVGHYDSPDGRRHGFIARLVPKAEGDHFGNFYTATLSKGLNMISVPLAPPKPMTAKSLVAMTGATTIITLDAANQHFIAWTPSAPDDGFPVEGGKGYIVNVPETRNFAFVGAPWTDPTEAAAAAPSVISTEPPKEAWAFVVSGHLEGKPTFNGYKVVVRNLRTNSVMTTSVQGDYFAAATADLTRRSVVEVGDVIEVRVIGPNDNIESQPLSFTVTPENLANAVLSLRLDGIGKPTQNLLLQNYPNPFNPETWIPYQLSEDTPVSISIYDTTGRLVRTLSLGFQSAGFYNSRSRAAYWDGRNALGERVASGIYFYQLTTPSFQQTRRLVIVK